MTWKVPAPRTVRTTVYQGLRGVDFTSDPALVDRRRSPEAVNLMGDATGNPEKRPGWRTLATLNDPIDFLGYFRLGEAGFFLLIAGAGLYRWAGDGTAPAFLHTLSAPLVDGECAAFVMGERLWLATGADYLVYDGETVQPVSQIATVPVTAINRPPTGEGGAALQPVNRLTGKRINRFRGDGESTVYQLDNVIAGDAAASAVKPNSVTARRLNADGTWSDLAVSSVDLAAGTVTFSSAPAESPFADRDNIEITYEKAQNELSSVTACRRGVLFGLGGANRIFLTGDPAHPGRDLWSEIHDPAYFPDVNYAQVGSDASPIQGYCRLNGALAVVKAENGQDATVYLRSAAQEESTGGALFPLTQGAAGLGALAPRSFGNLQDEPLFLSPPACARWSRGTSPPCGRCRTAAIISMASCCRSPASPPPAPPCGRGATCSRWAGGASTCWTGGRSAATARAAPPMRGIIGRTSRPGACACGKMRCSSAPTRAPCAASTPISTRWSATPTTGRPSPASGRRPLTTTATPRGTKPSSVWAAAWC